MANHLETVSAIYAAFGKGDIPSIIQHLSDNVQWEAWADNSAQKAGVPWLQARSGKASALQFFEIVSTFKLREFRVLSLLAGGNQVAAEFVIEFEAAGTGAICRDEEMHLWTFDDNGKVIRLRHYADTAKHMAAAGKGN